MRNAENPEIVISAASKELEPEATAISNATVHTVSSKSSLGVKLSREEDTSANAPF